MIVELHKNNVINIPEDITRKLMLEDGDLLDLYVKDGSIMLVPIKGKGT